MPAAGTPQTTITNGSRARHANRSATASRSRAAALSRPCSLLTGILGRAQQSDLCAHERSVRGVERDQPIVARIAAGVPVRTYEHACEALATDRPMFWTVRAGQSFGSIAAKTRINITKLEQLNPRLKPSALQPGDRVRLRR